jgi:hypothetical protein
MLAGRQNALPAPVPGFSLAYCAVCSKPSFWRREALIWPSSSTLPAPNQDLSDEIRADFLEARDIAQKSPRGAAALFRLCIQKLCIELGHSGTDLNGAIAALVKTGLNLHIQKSLDIVRVIGNEAVHPGTLDLKDDAATAEQLARLVNIIADALVSQPKAVEQLYSGLPASKREAIEARDAKKSDV